MIQKVLQFSLVRASCSHKLFLFTFAGLGVRTVMITNYGAVRLSVIMNVGSLVAFCCFCHDKALQYKQI